MAVISGKSLAINGESTVTKWKVTDVRMPVPFVASNTSNGVVQACGIKDWKGEYTLIGQDKPLIYPGGPFVQFKGSVDGSRGIYGEVLGRRMTIVADMLRNIPFTTRIEFEGNGAPTYGDAVVSDTTDPDVICSEYGLIWALTDPTDATSFIIGGNASWETTHDSLDIAGWSLMMEALNVQYSSTQSTGYRKRMRGPFSAAAQIRIFHDFGDATDGLRLPNVGDTLYQVKFMTGPDMDSPNEAYPHILFSHMKVLSLEPNVEALPAEEEGEPVSWTMTLAFSAWKEDDETYDNKVVIVDDPVGVPEGVQIFPYPAGY